MTVEEAAHAGDVVIVRVFRVDELGFDPIDAGGLDESWRQQPDSPVYIEDFDADGVRNALAEASTGGRGRHLTRAAARTSGSHRGRR